jgi:hypothetical protein
LEAGYTFGGSIYDITGGSGYVAQYQFQGAAAFDLGAADLRVEKNFDLDLQSVNVTTTAQVRLGDGNTSLSSTVDFNSAILTGGLVRVDADAAGDVTLDFSGTGASLVADQDATSISGTQRFVDDDSGNDNGGANDCETSGSPCLTLDNCIAQAISAGSTNTCLLDGGTYDETGGGNPRDITVDLHIGLDPAKSGAIIINVDDADTWLIDEDVSFYELSIVGT